MATKETITLTELQRLISACMNVMSSIDMLGIGKDDSLNSLYNDVLGSLRKLVVATTLSKRQIICISGLQGAGKTTLMQNFYGLENVLKGTLGVGERLPVLITEKESITEPELYSVKIIKNFDGKMTEAQEKLELAGMMGIDAIADGKINFIPQIAQSIEANPVVVGSIFAAILVIGGSVVVIRDINKMNCDDYKASLAALNRIYTELEAKTLSFFDDYMDKIKERIRETLYTINGSQAFATAEYNAKVEITNAIGIINTISERCKRDATGLGGLLY